MTDIAVKKRLVAAALHFKKLGYLAAADGNISCRLEGQRLLMTPSGRNKEFIQVEDIAELDLFGVTMSGQPSSEKRAHLAIYNRIPAARWVMHAHPPFSIAWSIHRPDDCELDITALPEVILGVGSIPIVPYATPGEEALARAIGEAATKSKSMIMQRHGVLSWGETWEEAINGVERVEHAARVLSLSISMGGYSHLSDDELAEIRKKRRILGQQSL